MRTVLVALIRNAKIYTKHTLIFKTSQVKFFFYKFNSTDLNLSTSKNKIELVYEELS